MCASCRPNLRTWFSGASSGSRTYRSPASLPKCIPHLERPGPFLNSQRYHWNFLPADKFWGSPPRPAPPAPPIPSPWASLRAALIGVQAPPVLSPAACRLSIAGSPCLLAAAPRRRWSASWRPARRAHHPRATSTPIAPSSRRPRCPSGRASPGRAPCSCSWRGRGARGASIGPAHQQAALLQHRPDLVEQHLVNAALNQGGSSTVSSRPEPTTPDRAAKPATRLS